MEQLPGGLGCGGQIKPAIDGNAERLQAAATCASLVVANFCQPLKRFFT